MQNKDTILCERFAAGLADHTLQRDVRRYIQEHRDVSFATLRSKVLAWEFPLVPVSGVRSAHVSTDHGQLQQRLDQQEEQLRATQAAVDKLCQQVSQMLPSLQQTSPTGAMQGHGGLTCYSCGGIGHIKRVCPTGRGRYTRPARRSPHDQPPSSGQAMTPQSSWAEATPFTPAPQPTTSKTSTESPKASPPS